LLKRQRWAHLKKIVPFQQMGISWSDDYCAPQCASPRGAAKGDKYTGCDSGEDSDARSVQSALPEGEFSDNEPPNDE